MKIRQKIILYFSATTIILVGISFLFIYSLFSNYRSEEFQQRLKDKVVTTLKFLVEIQQIDNELLQTMDKYTINNLYQERTLLFDENKNLIYSGINDTPILSYEGILKKISPSNKIVHIKEKEFDVVGVYVNFKNKGYYGINKAYDKFGFSKLNYLKYVLFISFLIITIFIVLITFFLSKQISSPLNKMAKEIENLQLESNETRISIPNTKDEIYFLANRFNELMNRLNDAFAFQKHAIHHISHELKTPIAILVSNFEKIEKEKNIDAVQEQIKNQKEDTKNLSDIINALLEISKVETGNNISKENLRVDELIYDVIEDLKNLDEEFNFTVDISDTITDERKLTVHSSKKLITLAFVNLTLNCVLYSKNKKALIKINYINNEIIIEFVNEGPIIKEQELHFLFQHFFRGENSKGKRGFGLGLVLIYKIITMYSGKIYYESIDEKTNVFKVILPINN